MEVINEVIEEPIEKKSIRKRPLPDRETLKKQSKISQIKIKIAQLDKKLKEYDYIGTKIATGRATVEEYATQIAQMDEWAKQINALEERLKEIK